MSGPGGSVTKRDKRRETRRAQLQQRQLERQRERLRQLRNQRIRMYTLIGAPIAVILLIVLAFTVIGHNNSSQPKGNGGLAPAHGQTVDGMACLPAEGQNPHNHTYLELYVNGKPSTVPPGIGIVAPQGSGITALGSSGLTSCLYPLHVHEGQPNIIHIELFEPRAVHLGEFFDIWGQALSNDQVLSYKADASHKLVFEVFDANGKLTQYTGDPRQIELNEHETIAILYNSPNVTPKPYTDWNGL